MTLDLDQGRRQFGFALQRRLVVGGEAQGQAQVVRQPVQHRVAADQVQRVDIASARQAVEHHLGRDPRLFGAHRDRRQPFLCLPQSKRDADATLFRFVRNPPSGQIGDADQRHDAVVPEQVHLQGVFGGDDAERDSERLIVTPGCCRRPPAPGPRSGPASAIARWRGNRARRGFRGPAPRSARGGGFRAPFPGSGPACRPSRSPETSPSPAAIATADRPHRCRRCAERRAAEDAEACRMTCGYSTTSGWPCPGPRPDPGPSTRRSGIERQARMD